MNEVRPNIILKYYLV